MVLRRNKHFYGAKNVAHKCGSLLRNRKLEIDGAQRLDRNFYFKQVRERLIAGAKRGADDKDQLLVSRLEGDGEQSDVAAESVRAGDQERLGLRPAEQRTGEERLLSQAGGLVADRAATVEDLGEAAGCVGDGCGRRLAQAGVALADDCGDAGRARAQALVERAVQRAREVVVEEEAAACEHRADRGREGEREPGPDRQPLHPPVSRRR